MENTYTPPRGGILEIPQVMAIHLISTGSLKVPDEVKKFGSFNSPISDKETPITSFKDTSYLVVLTDYISWVIYESMNEVAKLVGVSLSDVSDYEKCLNLIHDNIKSIEDDRLKLVAKTVSQIEHLVSERYDLSKELLFQGVRALPEVKKVDLDSSLKISISEGYTVVSYPQEKEDCDCPICQLRKELGESNGIVIGIIGR